jgi:hypothetical protein
MAEGVNEPLLDRLGDAIDRGLKDHDWRTVRIVEWTYHELGPFGCSSLNDVNRKELARRYRQAGWSQRDVTVGEKSIKFRLPVSRARASG